MIGRQVIGWSASALLALCGLWSLYLAAFHSWVSWGPPSSRPEWHRAWSIRFALLALGAFVLAGVVLWTLRTRRPARVEELRDPP